MAEATQSVEFNGETYEFPTKASNAEILEFFERMPKPKNNPSLNPETLEAPDNKRSSAVEENPLVPKEATLPKTSASEDSFVLQLFKGLVGETAGIGKVIAGAPEFLYSVGGVPIQASKQAIENAAKGKYAIDWDKATADAQRVAAPLGALPKMYEEGLQAVGANELAENSKVSQAMQGLDTLLTTGSKETAKATGLPEKGVRNIFDLATILVPIPKISKVLDKASQKIAPEVATSATKPIADAMGKDVLAEPTPVIRPTTVNQDVLGETKSSAPYSPINFADDLYKLNDLKKLDETNLVKAHMEIISKEVPLELQEKFARYDEGQALNNERINSNIAELNRQITSEFKTLRELQSKPAKEVVANKDNILRVRANIESLKGRKADLESKRGKREELSLEEQTKYNTYFKPFKEELAKLTEYAEKEKIAAPFGKDTDFATRKTIKPEKEKTIWESYKEAIIGRDYTMQERTYGDVASATQQRKYFVLEDPFSGKRDVVSIVHLENGNSTILPIVKKKPIKDGELQVPGHVKTGDVVQGKLIREATVPEIEFNTNQIYAKDYSLVLGEKLLDLRDQVRRHEFAKDILNNRKYKSLRFKPENYWDKIPEGFEKPTHLDKMPELEGYYFESRIAEMISDYNKPYVPTKINTINNTLVTNMMLVPVAHMMNEGVHWGITRGISGLLNPLRVYDMAKSMGQAWKEVKNRGEVFREIMQEGGSIMSANVRNDVYLESAYQKSLKQFSESQGFKDIAKAVAISPANLYKRISKLSNKSMWTVRDVLYTQLVLEKKMKGMSTKEAIQSVERHMPNYRLPSRLVFDNKLGRGMSVVLGNRSAFLFARYHTGMLASAKNTIKDIAMMDKSRGKREQLLEGVDSAIAIGVAMSVLYPMLDHFAEFIANTVEDFTGESEIEESKFRRPGVLHVLDTANEIRKAEKDEYSLATILVTPSPVLQVALEVALNKELYNNKKIINWGEDPDVIADKYLKYLTRKIPQANQALQATNEDYGTGVAGWILRNFFDIKTKTKEQVKRVEDQVKRSEKEAKKTNRSYEGLIVEK